MSTSFARETLELHGSFPDILPQDAPATGWNTSANVYFENGGTQRVVGNTPVYAAPDVEARALVFYTNASGEHFWCYATDTGLHAYDGTMHHDLTPASGWAPTSESVITMITFNGAVIINDSVTGPWFWNGAPTSDFARLPNWPATWRVVSMRSHKSFLFGIGRLDTSGFQRVNWSDAAEAGTLPASWEPAADNLAGFVDLLPASSPCVDGFTLRDEFLVFKGETVWAFAFVGGNAVFASRQRWHGIGLAGVNGWCIGPSDQALFLGSDGDIYRTDGINYGSVLDGIAQRTYYQESDPDQLTRVCAATLSRIGISMLAYPTVGAAACDRAILFTWASGEIGFRDMPQVTCLASGRHLDSGAAAQNVWDTATGNWNSDGAAWNFALSPATANDVVGGSLNGFWWLSGTTDDTIPLPAYALKQGIAFGNPQARKLVSRVWPKIEGESGDVVQVRVGAQDITGGMVTWAPVQDFVIGGDAPVDAFASGRFMALEVSAQGGAVWRLGTLDVEYREQGGW